MHLNPGSARYIGRVGALAVALGVGAAIASMPTAWAGPDDATSADAANPGPQTSPGPAPRARRRDPGARLNEAPRRRHPK